MEQVKLSAEHLRGARALLRWSQAQLAERSGVSQPTVRRLEAGEGPINAHRPTVDALRRALEAAGIELLNGGAPGVRLRGR